MNISKWLSPIVVFSIFGQGAQAFDNSSLTGCYASSLYGNILGPQITVDAEGNLVPDFQTLVLHGTASVGRVCFDGAGNVTEINATQNIAGVCAIPYLGTGTYTVLADGTGSSSLSTTIPADAVLAPGCALFDAKPGDTATFTFTSVLDGQGCVKLVTLNAATATQNIPIVTEGEACQQAAQ